MNYWLIIWQQVGLFPLGKNNGLCETNTIWSYCATCIIILQKFTKEVRITVVIILVNMVFLWVWCHLLGQMSFSLPIFLPFGHLILLNTASFWPRERCMFDLNPLLLSGSSRTSLVSSLPTSRCQWIVYMSVSSPTCKSSHTSPSPTSRLIACPCFWRMLYICQITKTGNWPLNICITKYRVLLLIRTILLWGWATGTYSVVGIL